jgi:acyl-coenzyme A thioesterase PaaI-like protein
MSQNDNRSIQEIYAPNNVCYGCGPANERGIGLRSFVEGDQLIATWQADSHYQAFEGMLCGGVIGTLLDCHCNWTGAWQLMQNNQLEAPPCTVTAEYKIVLKAPTPMKNPIRLRANVVQSSQRKAVVHGELIAGDQVTATCEGVFVAVKEGHPAFHRW